MKNLIILIALFLALKSHAQLSGFSSTQTSTLRSYVNRAVDSALKSRDATINALKADTAKVKTQLRAAQKQITLDSAKIIDLVAQTTALGKTTTDLLTRVTGLESISLQLDTTVFILANGKLTINWKPLDDAVKILQDQLDQQQATLSSMQEWVERTKKQFALIAN